MKRILMAAVTLVLAMMVIAMPGFATATPTITVDGVTYQATKISGPTIHFETPDTNPVSAYTDRHTWTGNGSENLPCQGGIHWIDNANVLTISNCLEESTTTTSTPTSTSSTSTTTSTSTSTTSSTSTTAPTTTSTETSTTTTEASTTTTLPVTTSTLPFTGDATKYEAIGAGLLCLVGLGLILLVERKEA